MAIHYFNVKVSFALCPKLISLSLKTVLPVGSLSYLIRGNSILLVDQTKPFGIIFNSSHSFSFHTCMCVIHSCPILCHSWTVAHQAPGSFVHGFLQARILEWVAISFSTFRTYLNRKYCCLCFKLYPKSKCFPSSIASSLVPATTASLLGMVQPFQSSAASIFPLSSPPFW